MTDEQIMQMWYDTPAERFGDEIEDSEIIAFARALLSASKSAAPAQSGEPVAWVRYRSDGGFEGPIMNTDARMCDTRRGFWTPLYAAPQSSQPVEAGEPEWIAKLRKGLMLSKMTHNFTFSRDEVMALLAAPSAVTLDGERAAFEAWACTQPKHIIKDLQRYADDYPDKSRAGQYGHCTTADAWDIWRAARAASPQVASHTTPPKAFP